MMNSLDSADDRRSYLLLPRSRQMGRVLIVLQSRKGISGSIRKFNNPTWFQRFLHFLDGRYHGTISAFYYSHPSIYGTVCPPQMFLITGPRDQLAVIGSNIIQISKLITFRNPEIFASEYTSDCLDEEDIGCAWSNCKSSWNTKDTDRSIEDCFKVLALIIQDLTLVSCCIAITSCFGLYGLSCVIYVPRSRYPASQCRDSHFTLPPFILSLLPEIRIHCCGNGIWGDYVCE